MPDREKVIRAMECCAVGAECDHCPYTPMNKSVYEGCYQMHVDALALLKAQAQEIEDLKQEIEGHKDNLRETLDEMMRYADELKAQEARTCSECRHYDTNAFSNMGGKCRNSRSCHYCHGCDKSFGCNAWEGR